MFIISQDDIPEVKAKTCQVISTLNDGANRIDMPVNLGDELTPLVITGYWVNDLMRIDIQIKK